MNHMKKRVLLSTGIESINDFLMSFENDFEFEECSNPDELERIIKKYNPEIIVLSEKFGENEDDHNPLQIVETIRLISPARIIYMAKERYAGDPFLNDLIGYGIYDIFHKREIPRVELKERLYTPATLQSVAYLRVSRKSTAPDENQIQSTEPQVIIKEVPVEKVKEVIKEVPVEKIKEVPVEKKIVQIVEKPIIKTEKVVEKVYVKMAPEGFKKTISVVSPASTGKTFVAVNLAYMLSKDRATALVDLDLRKRSVYYSFNMAEAGIADSLKSSINAASVEDVIQHAYKPPGRKLRVYSDHRNIKQYDIMADEFYTLNDILKNQNDIVIYDCSSAFNNLTKICITTSDVILLVVTQDKRYLDDTLDLLVSMSKAKIPSDKVVLIVNKYKELRSITDKDIFTYLSEIEIDGKNTKNNFKQIFTIKEASDLAINSYLECLPAIGLKNSEELQACFTDIRNALLGELQNESSNNLMSKMMSFFNRSRER